MSAESPKEPETPPVPKGIWGSVLKTTPIVLTVLATALAGISSSEMTQSMYWRSTAAQHQSKAGDQWAFFQAKRIRGTNLETSVETIQSLGHPDAFDPAQFETVTKQLEQVLEASGDEKSSGGTEARKKAAAKLKGIREQLGALLADEKSKQSISFLTGAPIVKTQAKSLEKKDVQDKIDAVIDAIAQRRTESETAADVAPIKAADIEEATRNAEQATDAMEKSTDPVTKVVRQLRGQLRDLTAAVAPVRKSATQPLAQALTAFDGLNMSFWVAAQDFDSRRYRLEAEYNRKAAEMYEVRVRRSAVESDRHRERSKKFFYAMLIAQMGVTISSLALARSQKSIFWLLAAMAGATAVGFSGYIYIS